MHNQVDRYSSMCKKQKKILVLGGANQHVKLINAAQDMGVYTIVTDYLPVSQSPAKQVADEYWDISITDVAEIVAKCRAEGVDGVMAAWLDPCQIPYCQICKELNVPCYGTEEQFFLFTNKHAFKELCMKNAIGIIPEFSEEDVHNGQLQYPLFVKPVDSRGSRGQSVCVDEQSLLQALQFAKAESSDGDVIIEKFIENKDTFQVTYMFVDGEPYILRTTDGYSGTVEDKLDNVALCSISPSRYSKEFVETVHPHIVEMMKSIGFTNGPVMLQGFYDEGVFRFFDPGLRFPGVEYDDMIAEVFGIDVMKMMVEFALTGEFSEYHLSNEAEFLGEKRSAVLFPTITAGKINTISGVKELLNDESCYSVSLRHKEGETVKWSYDVNQRIAEVNIMCGNLDELKQKIAKVYQTLQVVSDSGDNMMYVPFNVDRIKHES